MKRSLEGHTGNTVKVINKRDASFGTSVDHASYFDAERPLMKNALPSVRDFLIMETPAFILSPLNYEGVK